MIGINKGALGVVNPNLKLELKFNYQTYTDLAATVAAGTNDYVRSWRSSVGGHLLTQSTDAARPQRVSDGLCFDGGDLLSILTPASFNWGSGNFTVEWWSSSATPLSGSPVNISVGGPANYWAGFCTSNAYVILANAGGSAWNSAASFSGVSANTWTHFAVVRDSGVLRTYKDGSQLGTANNTQAMYYNASFPIYLGCRYPGALQFTGKMTDIRLYTACIYPSGTSFTPPTRSA